jgi:antibiotic biosynthesis monooxygenase (ABM) superfamily enzyme
MRGINFGMFHRNQLEHRTFDSRQTAPRTQPRRYKMFLLTWLAIYPLITGIYLNLSHYSKKTYFVP